jgi:hypothetical protein
MPIFWQHFLMEVTTGIIVTVVGAYISRRIGAVNGRVHELEDRLKRLETQQAAKTGDGKDA